MKVILLKDIKRVGKKFDEKEVSDGYATNFLIPKKMAVPMSGQSAGMIQELKRQDANAKEKETKFFSENFAKLSGAIFNMPMKANESGHLFASITAAKLSGFLKQNGVEISSDHIDLKSPIKETGTFEVPVSVGDEKKINFTLEVTPLD